MPLTRAPRQILTSWVDNPRPSCPHKKNGAELWKRPFREMTFQPSLSNGARLRLIEINGVLFSVLKCRMRKKETSTSSQQDSWADLRYGNVLSWVQTFYTEISDERTNEQKERIEKLLTVRPAGLKTWRSFSYTITTKISCFLTVLFLIAQCKMHYWRSVTWLGYEL
jgi:hypothetical protein